LNAKKIIRNLLLAFVLISIGFALGKEYTLRTMKLTQPGTLAAGRQNTVIVYYLHGNIRCVTCNNIEKMAKEIVQRDFAQEVQAGRIEWRAANYQKDEEMALRYNAFSSAVVLVRQTSGKEAEFKKLGEVWILADDPPRFTKYVSDEIRAFLAGGPS